MLRNFQKAQPDYIKVTLGLCLSMCDGKGQSILVGVLPLKISPFWLPPCAARQRYWAHSMNNNIKWSTNDDTNDGCSVSRNLANLVMLQFSIWWKTFLFFFRDQNVFIKICSKTMFYPFAATMLLCDGDESWQTVPQPQFHPETGLRNTGVHRCCLHMHAPPPHPSTLCFSAVQMGLLLSVSHSFRGRAAPWNRLGFYSVCAPTWRTGVGSHADFCVHIATEFKCNFIRSPDVLILFI